MNAFYDSESGKNIAKNVCRIDKLFIKSINLLVLFLCFIIVD